MKFKKSHNLFFLAILVIFSMQLVGLGVLFFGSVNEASAQGYTPYDPQGTTFTPQVTIPGSDDFVEGSPIPMASKRGLMIAEYIQAWYKFAVAAVGILAVVMIMAGGLIWLTAGGKADQVSTAKDWIMGAIMGLVLALMSYTLLDILNPNLVTFQSLNIPEIAFVESGVCCFPFNGTTIQANSAGTKESCIFRDKEKKEEEVGKRCNILQACRIGEDNGSYDCVNIEEGKTSCKGSTVDDNLNLCPEGWFCVNDICWNGGAGDPCDIMELSCANGFYCLNEGGTLAGVANKYTKTICFDGAKGDPCDDDDNKDDQCNKPMLCKNNVCQYDKNTGHCQPLGAGCDSNSDCCIGGDCESWTELTWSWSGKCVSEN